MKYPKSIRIGPYDVKILTMSGDRADARKAFGFFTGDTISITMDESIPCPIRATEVFIHEVFHAVCYIYNIEIKKDNEERIVYAMGVAWTQIYRDNPHLLKWITKNLKE